MNRFLYFVFCVLVVLSSCSKGSGPKPTKTAVHGFDVYVLGECGISYQHGSVGGYWKNGEFKALTDTTTPSYVRSMTVNGPDVYVAGNYLYNGGGYYAGAPAYWKNGKMYDMPDASSVACVAVKGTDLYIGGSSYGDNGGVPKCTYWKNGVRHVLVDNSSSEIIGIHIDGNDVYMVGYLGGKMAYWKNDNLMASADIEGNDGLATRGYYISSGNVYFCGEVYNNANYVASYWKNGVFQNLENSNSQASGIILSGQDVYCSGYKDDPSGFVGAYYWKNGAATKLDASACATSIAIDGTDLYVGGYLINGDYNLKEAAYWLNGNRIKLVNPYYKPKNIYTTSTVSQVVLVRY